MDLGNREHTSIDVSVIVPVHNGEQFVDECLRSVLDQTAREHLTLEVSVFDDASSDGTLQLLRAWQERCVSEPGLVFTLGRNLSPTPGGVGFAKNRAVEQSCGDFLCFQDIDDVMEPDRILAQYREAKEHPLALIGSQFKRSPAGSTARFSRWANSLRPEQLTNQVYTSHGPTVIMPTWFCSRSVFLRVGGFSEAGAGTPEDLLFFYEHLDRGGEVRRVDKSLVVYRYHAGQTTFSISQHTIWAVRLERLQRKVLVDWPRFTIWNAGKRGRQLYRGLSLHFRERVVAFCDVDCNKVGRHYEPYRSSTRVPIVHFTCATPPFVVCVKLDLTGGSFEENLCSLNLVEGKDYVLFS